MQHIVTEIIEHLSHSNSQMARMLEAKRHVTVRMAEIVKSLPDHQPNFGGVDDLLGESQALLGSVIAYLNSMAELQETLASQLSYTIKELNPGEEE
ncbi:nucleoside-diphosphate sugar epimerase [Paenibacillus algorifonticola]|uniref:nucleoside-diphosphate sugar epimerase n=1 Tax=Paenibacillus algorifonticola TaxID=684063 RepID=UPI003D293B0A